MRICFLTVLIYLFYANGATLRGNERKNKQQKDGDCHFVSWPVANGENFTQQIDNKCITFKCVNGSRIPLHYQCKTYEGLCKEVNETYLDYYNCTTNTCVEENGDYHLVTSNQGCVYGPNCFALNETHIFECAERRCEVHDNVYGMFIIKEGCPYGDEEELCLNPGEQTVHNCKTYSCDEDLYYGEVRYMTNILQTLCRDVHGTCKKAGEIVETSIPDLENGNRKKILNCTCYIQGTTDEYSCP